MVRVSTLTMVTLSEWVSRKNANVDRVACPWLIKRFVDAEAEFVYVPTDQVVTVAERDQAIPYDVKDVQLGHVDGRCSFDSAFEFTRASDHNLTLCGLKPYSVGFGTNRGIAAPNPCLEEEMHVHAPRHEACVTFIRVNRDSSCSQTLSRTRTSAQLRNDHRKSARPPRRLHSTRTPFRAVGIVDLMAAFPSRIAARSLVAYGTRQGGRR
jgi:hypothetical protein